MPTIVGAWTRRWTCRSRAVVVKAFSRAGPGHRAPVTQAPEQDRTEEQPSRPGVGSDPAHDQAVAEKQVEDAFKRSVDQGRNGLILRGGLG